MIGWNAVFALITLAGFTAIAIEFPAPATAPVMTSLLFSVLLVVSLLLNAIRSRA